MTDSATSTNVIDLGRTNLRLPAETFEAIDRARITRPSQVSRSTWLTEAVEEKLARDAAHRESGTGERHYG
jgi:hypothetical protein